jgi:hypothetical protein
MDSWTYEQNIKAAHLIMYKQTHTTNILVLKLTIR